MLWFNGIRRLPAAAPPLLGLAAPVTGALLGWVVLGQSLSPVQLAGFVVTLGAIAYGALLGASAAVGDDGLREQRVQRHDIDSENDTVGQRTAVRPEMTTGRVGSRGGGRRQPRVPSRTVIDQARTSPSTVISVRSG